MNHLGFVEKINRLQFWQTRSETFHKAFIPLMVVYDCVTSPPFQTDRLQLTGGQKEGIWKHAEMTYLLLADPLPGEGHAPAEEHMPPADKWRVLDRVPPECFLSSVLTDVEYVRLLKTQVAYNQKMVQLARFALSVTMSGLVPRFWNAERCRGPNFGDVDERSSSDELSGSDSDPD